MAVHRRGNHLGRHGSSIGADDRRGSCRYTVVQDNGWLGWWEGQAFVNTTARLLDISLRGAMMIVDVLPPATDEVLWFCPPGVKPAEWLEAKLVQGRKRIFGPREVRIAFRHAFPYETFKALVYGHDKARGYELLPHEPLDSSEQDWW